MTNSLNNRSLFKRVFENLPADFRVVPGGDDGADLIVRAGKARYAFQIKSAGEGWPSDVKQVLGSVRKKWPRDLIVIARRFSPGSLELLRSQEANWADAAGNMHVYAPPGLFIDRVSPLSNISRGISRGNGFAWSLSSIDIAEELLSETGKRIRVSELANSVGWSSARVTSILRGFDEMGWTHRHGGKQGQGVWRELVKPGSMLEAWTDHVSKAHVPSRSAHALMRDPMGFLREQIAPILSKEVKWAVTTWGAATILAPYAAFIPMLHVYVPDEFLRTRRFESAIEAARLREVEEGANVVFRGANPRLFRHVLKRDIPIASVPRVYADLMSLGDRASDAARHLRETLLEY